MSYVRIGLVAARCSGIYQSDDDQTLTLNPELDIVCRAEFEPTNSLFKVRLSLLTVHENHALVHSQEITGLFLLTLKHSKHKIVCATIPMNVNMK